MYSKTGMEISRRACKQTSGHIIPSEQCRKTMQTDYESKRQNGFEDAQQPVRRSETIAAAQL
mgnify:CR=1 FL=1